MGHVIVCYFVVLMLGFGISSSFNSQYVRKWITNWMTFNNCIMITNFKTFTVFLNHDTLFLNHSCYFDTLSILPWLKRKLLSWAVTQISHLPGFQWLLKASLVSIQICSMPLAKTNLEHFEKKKKETRQKEKLCQKWKNFFYCLIIK